MKIVIDIPEVFYEALRKTDEIISGRRSGKTLMSTIFDAVANGIPLPKHGRLIDAEKLAKEIFRAWTLWEKKGGNCYLFSDTFTSMLVSQLTIIEADRK